VHHTVLVPLDGSPLAERALPYALVLARASQARLLLVRVVSAPAGHRGGYDAITASRARDAELYLRDVAAQFKRPLVVETAVFVGDVVDSIVEEIALRQVDVVAMSTHGRSGLGRWVYGSVADQIMRRASVPVLLIPARADVNWPTDRSLRVLVPLDGSDYARDTLDLIAGLVDSLGAEVRLLEVTVPRPYSYASAVAYPAADVATDAGAARTYLEGVAKEMSARGWSVAVETAFGSAAAMIALAAKEGRADLIAMSTHGSSGLTRLVMGSVATGVVQQSVVPVLILRPCTAVPADQEVPAQSDPPLWSTLL
jgi:nucleotide-binding universal stress UspA family protein